MKMTSNSRRIAVDWKRFRGMILVLCEGFDLEVMRCLYNYPISFAELQIAEEEMYGRGQNEMRKRKRIEMKARTKHDGMC